MDKEEDGFRLEGGLSSRPPRGPQLRSDPRLSNSMNSGESSSVASVRDYQHTHTSTNTTTSHALTATVLQNSQVEPM